MRDLSVGLDPGSRMILDVWALGHDSEGLGPWGKIFLEAWALGSRIVLKALCQGLGPWDEIFLEAWALGTRSFWRPGLLEAESF